MYPYWSDNSDINHNDITSNLLNLISICLNLQNLQENREQSAHNDVQSANDSQAHFLLTEIHKEFQEQNARLERIENQIQLLLNKLDP